MLCAALSALVEWVFAQLHCVGFEITRRHDQSLDFRINLQFDSQDKIESSRKRTRSLSELTLNSETSIDLSEYWLLTGKGKTWQLRISTCPCKKLELEQNINWHFVLKYPEIYIVHYCMKNVYSLYIIIVFDRCVKVFCIKGLRMRYTLFRKLKNKNPIFLIF